jgi:hypothetical protein
LFGLKTIGAFPEQLLKVFDRVKDGRQRESREHNDV